MSSGARTFLAIAFLASTLPGCAANEAAPPARATEARALATPLAGAPLRSKRHGWMSPAATMPQSLIYVADGNAVVVFPEAGFNPAPVGEITDGVTSAYGLYVDGRRNLYVANRTSSPGIAVYPPGATAPSIVYPDSRGPLYPVTDRTGRVYAGNGDGTVVEFRSGHTTPDRLLHTPGIEVDGINLDAADNLYVAYRGSNGDGSIEKFPPNSTQGEVLGMTLVQPQGLELDSAGNILVVETGDKFVIDEFPPGSQTPSQQLHVAHGVTQIALRESERYIYVSNYEPGKINAYMGLYPLSGVHPKIEADLGTVQGIAASNEEHF
ncbi:MAG: hypothetical protein WB615_10150 [Candidatus Tumulicola sp.]